jgi:glutathione S-transferase
MIVACIESVAVTSKATSCNPVLIRRNVMMLYGAPVSPFVRKVLAYAAEKGLELPLTAVGIGDPNPEFRRASPFKKMPAFVDGDFSISDSTAIITYLEAKYPTPPMIPTGAEDRARVIWFEECGDSILTGAMGPIFFQRIVSPKFLGVPGDEAIAAKAEAEGVPMVCDYLETVVPAEGFLVGDSLTLADIAVASPFVNLSHCGIPVDPDTYPKLVAYLARILGRDSFAVWIKRERKMLGLGV